MKYKVYKERDVVKILKKNGFELERHSGDHKIYYNEKTNTHISIVHRCDNPMIIRRLIKEYNLNE